MGLRVVRDDGGPIRFRHALVRGLIGVVLEKPGITLGFLAFVTIAGSSRHKRVGDMLAGTDRPQRAGARARGRRGSRGDAPTAGRLGSRARPGGRRRRARDACPPAAAARRAALPGSTGPAPARHRGRAGQQGRAGTARGSGLGGARRGRRGTRPACAGVGSAGRPPGRRATVRPPTGRADRVGSDDATPGTVRTERRVRAARLADRRSLSSGRRRACTAPRPVRRCSPPAPAVSVVSFTPSASRCSRATFSSRCFGST